MVSLGVGAVITGNLGPKAFAILQAGNVKTHIGAAGSVSKAVEQLEAELAEEFDKGVVTACIGPAGENLVRFAAVMFEGRTARAAGRCGFGATIGSKNLKAMVIAKPSGENKHAPVYAHTEALKDAGREDIICVAAGSSRTGLNYIKASMLHAVTYQSAEADGALPIQIAAEWFSGKKIERPVYYLRKKVITKENVEEFLPAQW